MPKRPSWASTAAGFVAAALAGALAAVLAAGAGDDRNVGATAVRVPEGAVVLGRTRVISRPGYVSRWAYVGRPVMVRAAPEMSARTLGRLGTRTGDQTTELVLTVQRRRDASGRVWLRVRTPLLPTGTVGWVPRSALAQYHRVDTWLLVDRSEQRLALVRSGRIVFRAEVGVGEAVSPTPAGRFYVRSRLLGLAPDGIYGSAAFGTSARSTKVTDWPGEKIVGIHGTNRPDLIPGRVSHGCIRLRNEDIRRLVGLMPVGTPVTIL